MARIHVLGAGTPTPTPTRFGSSFALELPNGEQLMVDCGPSATHKLVKVGVWPTNIDYMFFTHHHFDHDVDYPCFLLCRWDQSIGTENKLKVFGPPPTEKLTREIIGSKGAFAHDWKARIGAPGSQQVFMNRGGTLPRTPPEVLAKDIGPGKVYSGDDWEVTAAPALHVQPFLDSLAYRFDTSDGSIVFTGDTEPCDSVRDLAKDADLMLCMCWDEQGRMEQMGEAVGQCGTTAAAQLAQEAGVKKLALVHIGPNLSEAKAAKQAIEDTKSIFDGEIIFTDELMSFDI